MRSVRAFAFRSGERCYWWHRRWTLGVACCAVLSLMLHSFQFLGYSFLLDLQTVLWLFVAKAPVRRKERAVWSFYR